MAKTIEEMAHEYAELLPQKRIAKKFCKIDYKAGANAIISEIEKTYHAQGAFGVIELIKELKGK